MALLIGAWPCNPATAATASAVKPSTAAGSAPAAFANANVQPGRDTGSSTRPDPSATRVLALPGAGRVSVYAPPQPSDRLALFASGDGGWNKGVRDMAHAAADLGFWVAGFSTPVLLKSLQSGTSGCVDAAAALAGLGRRVREAMRLPTGPAPILLGYSSGATLAYAAMAQAGDDRFSGALTLGFCPDLMVHKPFCRGANLTAHRPPAKKKGIVFDAVPRLAAPWIVLQGDIDKVCNPPATVAFVDQVRNARVIALPHVGHGYGVPRNWMPQYRRGLVDLRNAKPAASASAGQ